MNITYKFLSGHELEEYLDELADLRITVFKEYPYLYHGNKDYEYSYLKVYQNSPDSLIALALLDNKVIGATTCIPLAQESEEFQACFKNANFKIHKIFYFGESVIYQEFRGNKIGHEFFKIREKHANKIIPDLEYTCFCAVQRSQNDTRRPAQYKPLDQFWNRMGYTKEDQLMTKFSWKELGEEKESLKPMSFWLKKW